MSPGPEEAWLLVVAEPVLGGPSPMHRFVTPLHLRG
jgi:hypothetical protein